MRLREEDRGQPVGTRIKARPAAHCRETLPFFLPSSLSRDIEDAHRCESRFVCRDRESRALCAGRIGGLKCIVAAGEAKRRKRETETQ